MPRLGSRYINRETKAAVLENVNCIYCGHPTKRKTIEHINPVSNGGRGRIDNLAMSCKRCNELKKGMSVHQFYFFVASKREAIHNRALIFIRKIKAKKGKFIDESLLKYLLKEINKCRGEHRYFTNIIHHIKKSNKSG